MSEQQPTPCGTCHGTGGTTVDTSSDGITRQNWQSCTTCHGTGSR
ncbi:hypothetical protein ACH4ZX_03770 [Streptomyces sp. NPDC020490]